MALTPKQLRRQDMDNQISVHNIDDQGNITGQTGLSRVVARYGNISDLDSFSPELQAAIQGYQNPPPKNYMSDLLQQQLKQPGTPEYFTADYSHLQNPTNTQMGPGTMMPAGPNGMTGDPAERTVGDPSMDTSQGIGTQLPGPIAEITNFLPDALPDDFGPAMPGFNFEGGPAPKPSDYGNDFFNPDPRTLEEVKLMPGFNIGGPAPLEPGQKPNTTDIFGAGNNPINTPIAPMPSPVTPPPGMSSGHSHDDLLSGIGKLFEQYFPQRGGTSTPSATQPVFDAVGNSAPAQQTSPQVFGNMITPFGRQG
jgi:hypothetical protein